MRSATGRLVTGVVLAAALILTSAPATADYKAGVRAYRNKDFAGALKEFRPLAEQGHANAQNNLGVMYANGDGVAVDFAEALRWYGLAAEQGHRGAQFNLAVMYYRGEGVPQDYERALHWYHEAAAQGFPIAQAHIGHMYEEGLGVTRDVVTAYMWYELAAAHQFPPALEARGELATQMTPQQIAEAQRQAREWEPQRARRPAEGKQP